MVCFTTAQKRAYDFIVVGSGPAAASWVRTALKRAPNSRILMMERGVYSKVDILTEANPLKLMKATKDMLKMHNHEVMQGNCAGGGSSVNGYVWVTPSRQDLVNGYGTTAASELGEHLEEYEGFADDLVSPKPEIHSLHKLLSQGCEEQGVEIESSNKLTCRTSNRQTLFIGTPTLHPLTGVRRSAMSAVLEPLLRENYDQLDLMVESPVARVLFEDKNNAVGVVTADGKIIKAGKVILAAGCIETPAILQRSGVGDAAALSKHGIPSIVDNPLVGTGLGDKMLTDDMLALKKTPGSKTYDASLFVVNRVFEAISLTLTLTSTLSPPTTVLTPTLSLRTVLQFSFIAFAPTL